eukprot:TRINITY_DN6093_c0_g4_i1.p1 TRINITY_DN6093_c0_g4~~TRINITY_DN6093_c0_g4_i1.p1  ORF type:complete len:856 (+),score=188.23 TRINITY_DN6093_c0_g4_i1:104-2671(+)
MSSPEPHSPLSPLSVEADSQFEDFPRRRWGKRRSTLPGASCGDDHHGAFEDGIVEGEAEVTLCEGAGGHLLETFGRSFAIRSAQGDPFTIAILGRSGSTRTVFSNLCFLECSSKGEIRVRWAPVDASPGVTRTNSDGKHNDDPPSHAEKSEEGDAEIEDNDAEEEGEEPKEEKKKIDAGAEAASAEAPPAAGPEAAKARSKYQRNSRQSVGNIDVGNLTNGQLRIQKYQSQDDSDGFSSSEESESDQQPVRPRQISGDSSRTARRLSTNMRSMGASSLASSYKGKADDIVRVNKEGTRRVSAVSFAEDEKLNGKETSSDYRRRSWSGATSGSKDEKFDKVGSLPRALGTEASVYSHRRSESSRGSSLMSKSECGSRYRHTSTSTIMTFDDEDMYLHPDILASRGDLTSTASSRLGSSSREPRRASWSSLKTADEDEDTGFHPDIVFSRRGSLFDIPSESHSGIMSRRESNAFMTPHAAPSLAEAAAAARSARRMSAPYVALDQQIPAFDESTAALRRGSNASIDGFPLAAAASPVAMYCNGRPSRPCPCDPQVIQPVAPNWALPPRSVGSLQPPGVATMVHQFSLPTPENVMTVDSMRSDVSDLDYSMGSGFNGNLGWPAGQPAPDRRQRRLSAADLLQQQYAQQQQQLQQQQQQQQQQQHKRQQQQRQQPAPAPPSPSSKEAAPASNKNPVQQGDAGDGRTTLQLRNIPKAFMRDHLCEVLRREGLMNAVTFVYLPSKFSTQQNFGYAFVDMCTPADVERCWATFQGYTDWRFEHEDGLEPCEVLWGNMYQGQEAHIKRYQNSPVMHESVPDALKPAMYWNGQRLPFPPPTEVIKPPRGNRNIQQGKGKDVHFV